MAVQAVQIAALKQAARVDFAETPATLEGDAALDSAKNLAMLVFGNRLGDRTVSAKWVEAVLPNHKRWRLGFSMTGFMLEISKTAWDKSKSLGVHMGAAW